MRLTQKISQKGMTFAVLAGGLLLFHLCGKRPPSFPQMVVGSLRIAAMDTTTIDSISVELDDALLGVFTNPNTIEAIAGFHKLFVFTDVSAGTTRTVEVRKDETTRAVFWLASEGPYIGNIAPLFTVQDVNGQTHAIESLRGHVVLLAFFEHCSPSSSTPDATASRRSCRPSCCRLMLPILRMLCA